MTSHQIKRESILNLVRFMVSSQTRIPSYRSVVGHLKEKGSKTRRGNEWTEKRLFRFLQNAGYSGLWGLSRSTKPKLL